MILRLLKQLALIACVVAPLPQSPSAQEILRPAAPAPAADKPSDDKIPPGLTRYMGREVAQTMHFTGAPWLSRESRNR